MKTTYEEWEDNLLREEKKEIIFKHISGEEYDEIMREEYEKRREQRLRDEAYELEFYNYLHKGNYERYLKIINNLGLEPITKEDEQ